MSVKKSSPTTYARRLTVGLLVTLSWIPVGLFSGCVSQSAYQQAMDQNSGLSTELAQQRREIAQLNVARQQLEQQLADCRAEIQSLQQQNVEALAELERQASIYGARTEAEQKKITQLREQQQRLAIEQQREQQRYLALEAAKQQLEAVAGEQSSTISTLQQELERERIAREARLAKMANTYNELVGSLEDEIRRGEITISNLKNRLTVNLVEKILFASGSADLSAAGEKVIRQVGEVLQQVDDKNIRVEGHSDNLQIRAALQQKYPSNWELSAARAANVVRFLERNVGIAGEKLELTAYGPFRPLADNTSAEGRAQNRRIQIVLVPIDN